MTERYVIVTLNDDTNYGNRLQNYALTRLLGEYGEVTTAYCAALRKMPAWLAGPFHRTVKMVKLCAQGIKNRDLRLRVKRYKKFRKFDKKMTPTCVGVDIFKGVSPKRYLGSTFVFGSDQIWNYVNAHLDESLRLFSLYLGSFLPDDVHRVSYAASFGTSVMPPDDVRQAFRVYLPKFDALSVREFVGCKIIRDTTGLDAKVVLDPTLMLTANEWLSITEHFVPENEKYVLTYFLGKPTEEQQSCIDAYAREHGCVVRNMLDINDRHTYLADPQDFVELFAKASYVFTDSYHACCFSILFHKQFSVYSRVGMEGKSSMNSRMETLFEHFDLDFVMLESGLAPTIDYERVDALLAELRSVSASWLKAALRK